jgi:hypothetical protein
LTAVVPGKTHDFVEPGDFTGFAVSHPLVQRLS